MQWLWSYDQLAKVCRFKNTDSERLLWAVERLSTLYPKEAPNVLLEIIRKGEPNSAEEALDFFNSHQDKRFADPLREIYADSSGKTAGAIAGVLAKLRDGDVVRLFKQKYSGSSRDNIQYDMEGYIISLFYLAELKSKELKSEAERLFKELGGPGPGVEFAAPAFAASLKSGASITGLLELHLDHPEFQSLYHQFLEALGEHCGTDLNHASIDIVNKKLIADGEGEPVEMIKQFTRINERVRQSKLWNKKRPPLDMLKKQEFKEFAAVVHREVDNLIRHKKKELGEADYSRWESGVKGTHHDSLEAIGALALIIPRLPEQLHLHTAYAMLFLLYDLVNDQSVIGITIEEMPLEKRWQLFLEDRRSLPADFDGIGLFKTAEDLDRRVDQCFSLLENNPDSNAAVRIIRFLGSLEKPGYFERLMDMDFTDNLIWEEISREILRLGPEAALSIAASIISQNKGENPDKVFCALDVLADLPVEASVQLLLNNWEWLFSLDQAYFMMVLSNIADKRFIKPLKEEATEYGELEWGTCGLICKANGIKDPWVKQFGKKIKKYRNDKLRMERLLEEEKLEELLEEPLYLELECRRCHRVYTYKVRHMQVVPETLDIFIEDRINCYHCGAYDHYRLTPMVHMIVMPLLAAYMETVTESTDFDKLTITPTDSILVGGEKMSQQEILDYYKVQLAEDPDNPELLVGFANTLNSVKRAEESEGYFERAIQCDPNAVEAYLGMGQLEEHRGDLHEAYGYFWKLAEIIHTGNYYRLTTGVEEFKADFAHLFSYVAKSLKKPLHPNIEDILDAHHMH